MRPEVTCSRPTVLKTSDTDWLQLASADFSHVALYLICAKWTNSAEYRLSKVGFWSKYLKCYNSRHEVQFLFDVPKASTAPNYAVKQVLPWVTNKQLCVRARSAEKKSNAHFHIFGNAEKKTSSWAGPFTLVARAEFRELFLVGSSVEMCAGILFCPTDAHTAFGTLLYVRILVFTHHLGHLKLRYVKQELYIS